MDVSGQVRPDCRENLIRQIQGFPCLRQRRFVRLARIAELPCILAERWHSSEESGQGGVELTAGMAKLFKAVRLAKGLIVPGQKRLQGFSAACWQ